MPTSFLTPDQRAAFGRFTGPPSPTELAQYFHLDGVELATVRQMRGAANRLGLAALLCSVRFTGSFPIRRADIPDGVVSYLADQLGMPVSESFGGYFDSSAPTYKRHTGLIRARFGYRDFHRAPDAVLGVTRRVYGFCWAGDDKPVRLIEWACAWLIGNKVLLPGATTLERLIGRVRERVQLRLWHRLVDGLTADQRMQIEALFIKRDAESLGNLELLRASPLKRRQSDFLRHLDRLDALRGAGLRMMPPKGVPAAHLERLARVARRARPSAVAALKEPRRTATVAALFYTLEASAQDDAVELGEALIADLFREAELAKASHRQAHQRDLDKAVLLLRELAGRVIVDSTMSFDDWQNTLFAHWPRTSIEGAITTVDALVQPGTGKPRAELTARWHRARKLFFNIATRIELSNSPGGRDVAEAMAWLRSQPDWARAAVASAPTGVISKPWRAHILNEDGVPADAKAYVFATIDAWYKAVKRRDVFASPGIRYADPRAGLLGNREWEGTKGVVCRSLGRTLDSSAEVDRLAVLLDATFARVAARADQNPDLQFEVSDGKPRIVLSRLESQETPDSLIALRREVHHLMPRAGIPDILLEVMRRTGFAQAFTHLSDRPAQVEGFEISLCAVLVAQACNIGLEPLVREDHPALRQSRLGWVVQNFIRSETLAAANAMVVSAHAKLPVTQHWGDGQVASADGLRFLAPKTAIHAGPNPKYFGRGRGITWYNMLSDQYSGLGATVVPGTLRDSLAILALLLEQETELDPSQVMTDSAAYSDTIFGLFWLLGYQFCPRLADIGGARLWRLNKTADYGPLGAIAEGTVNIKLITENWEDLIRLAGSLKLGHLKAEGVMRILQVRDRPTTLAKALMHLGRAIKTLHILNYIDDADFRRQILVQLNRQEFRHKLARKIFHGDRGEVRNALRQGQEEKLGTLGLALNAVIHWNATYMQAAIAKLTADGQATDPADVARLSPILWRHISFLGRYEIALPESIAQGGLRPLRNPNYE
jgi:TnpA family transposase